MDSKQVIKTLNKNGWYHYDTRGSHHYFKHSTIKGKITVPHPKKDLPIGTLNAIWKQAGLK